MTVPGSTDAPQAVGGSWNGGAHVLGTTYARHAVNVVGGTLFVQVEGLGGSSGSVNGFQLVRQGTGPTGAVMAMNADTSVQSVEYAKLRECLLADKQVLEVPPK